MSFPPATEMFQFTGFASNTYVFSAGSPSGGVSPFGHPRINDRSHLPAAYRSVPRPSSPLGAKASTERPSHTHTSRHRPHAGPIRTTGKPRQRKPAWHVQSDSNATPRHPTRQVCQPAGLTLDITKSRFTMRNNTDHPSRPRPARMGFSGNGSIPWRRSGSNR
jgi:hypothetical protein